MALSELLLVGVELIQLVAHLSVSSAHLASENVTSLGGGT